MFFTVRENHYHALLTRTTSNYPVHLSLSQLSRQYFLLKYSFPSSFFLCVCVSNHFMFFFNTLMRRLLSTVKVTLRAKPLP